MMPSINTSRCSNIQELVRRLEVLSYDVEIASYDNAISKFMSGLIARFKYFVLFQPTQSDQVYTLLTNNQELLSNSLYKPKADDAVFATLETLRDRLSQDSFEMLQVSKIAEGIFSTLQKSNLILPNNRQSVLSYEVQLCQILNADVTDKQLMSQISKFAKDLRLATFQPLQYLDYLKTLPPNERVRCFELSCWMMNNGCLKFEAIKDMTYLMQCKPEVLNKAKLCCEVINRKKFDIDFVKAFIEIPEDDQNIAIHFMGRLSHHLSKYDSGALLLNALANGFKKLSISEIDEVVDLAYEQSAINDVGGFIEGLLAIDKEDRADVFKLIKDKIGKEKVGATIKALGEIKNKDKREYAWKRYIQIGSDNDESRAEEINYLSIAADVEERNEFNEQMSRLRRRFYSTNRISLAKALAKFPHKERALVTGLFQVWGPIPSTRDAHVWLDLFRQVEIEDRKAMAEIWDIEDTTYDYFRSLLALSPAERKKIIDAYPDLRKFKEASGSVQGGVSGRFALAKSLRTSFVDGASDLELARRLLACSFSVKLFMNIIVLVQLIPQDKRIKFLDGFLAQLQDGGQGVEQRIQMQDFLLSELQRNVRDQEFVKKFCAGIIGVREHLAIDEDSLLFQEVAKLISVVEGTGKKNAYTIYQSLKKAESDEPLLDLKMPVYSMSFARVEKSYSFDLTKVRDTAKTVSYVAKDIPDEFQPRQLKQLFTALRKRVQELPEDAQAKAEEEVGVLYSEASSDKMTLSKLESNLFNKPFMKEMTMERLPDEKVSFHYYKLACIVKSILSESNQVMEGKIFSAQEMRLLDSAHAMSTCVTGQRDGVDLIHSAFDRKARYLDDKDLSRGTGSGSVFEDIIREEIQMGFGEALREPAWVKVLGQKVAQASHQTEYTANRVGKQVGLNRQLTFDEHTHVLAEGLIDAPTQTLAEAVYETFPFDRFVTRVKDNINKAMAAFEGTPGQKYKEWEKLIDRAPKLFKECFDVTENDEGVAVINGINKRGVVEVIKSMGYLVVRS